MLFEDTNLKLTLISEDIKSYYTVRQLELENLTVSTGRFTSQTAASLFLFTELHLLLQLVKVLCTKRLQRVHAWEALGWFSMCSVLWFLNAGELCSRLE